MCMEQVLAWRPGRPRLTDGPWHHTVGHPERPGRVLSPKLGCRVFFWCHILVWELRGLRSGKTKERFKRFPSSYQKRLMFQTHFFKKIWCLRFCVKSSGRDEGRRPGLGRQVALRPRDTRSLPSQGCSVTSWAPMTWLSTSPGSLPSSGAPSSVSSRGSIVRSRERAVTLRQEDRWTEWTTRALCWQAPRESSGKSPTLLFDVSCASTGLGLLSEL